jgi:hypothetical protein
MLFANFDFRLVPEKCVVEYQVRPDEPRFNPDEMVYVRNEHGRTGPILEAMQNVLRDHKSFGKPVMDLWFKKPKEERSSAHTVTYEVVPGAAMTATQGALAYRVTRVVLVVEMKINESPLSMVGAGYRDMRVAHGEAAIQAGSLEGQKVRLVMTERQGQPPRGAIMFTQKSGSEQAAKVQTVEFSPEFGNDPENK